MIVEFLDTAEPGLIWFRTYYREQTQLRAESAAASLIKAQRLTASNPHLGCPHPGFADICGYSVQAINFSILYTVVRGRVWIIDLRDVCGLRSGTALRRFADELAARLDQSA